MYARPRLRERGRVSVYVVHLRGDEVAGDNRGHGRNLRQISCNRKMCRVLFGQTFRNLEHCGCCTDGHHLLARRCMPKHITKCSEFWLSSLWLCAAHTLSCFSLLKRQGAEGTVLPLDDFDDACVFSQQLGARASCVAPILSSNTHKVHERTRPPVFHEKRSSPGQKTQSKSCAATVSRSTSAMSVMLERPLAASSLLLHEKCHGESSQAPQVAARHVDSAEGQSVA